MSEKIHIEGTDISIKRVNEQDYISLTDMVKNLQNPGTAIGNWLRNRNTLEFLGVWEEKNNVDFNSLEFEEIRNKSGLNSFTMSVKNWIEQTGAKGIVSRAGRYGGTFAHVDIAFSFGAWISPVFQYRLITEFQRLRSEEATRQRIEWNAGRELSRLNAPLMTDSISKEIGRVPEKQKPGYYAREFDMLNEIVFGMTAKEWRAKNPHAKGNIRDTATTVQNILIANLENLNAYLIKNGASEQARRRVLANTCEDQETILNKKYLPE